MIPEFSEGVFVGRITSEDFHFYETFAGFDIIKQSHRDEYHLCFLQEKGTTSIEIDFEKYTLKPLSIIFIHQNQVHKMLSYKNATVSIWVMSDENLHPEYLKLLDDISPAKPLALSEETFSIISEAVSLCIKLSEQKEEKLHHLILNGSCNTID